LSKSVNVVNIKPKIDGIQTRLRPARLAYHLTKERPNRPAHPLTRTVSVHESTETWPIARFDSLAHRSCDGWSGWRTRGRAWA